VGRRGSYEARVRCPRLIVLAGENRAGCAALSLATMIRRTGVGTAETAATTAERHDISGLADLACNKHVTRLGKHEFHQSPA
jgi:hypothetical protein